MMEIFLGETGLDKTWQRKFLPKVECENSCDGIAEIAFVVYEVHGGKEENYVYHLHENLPGEEGFWPHDPIAMAVYFCRKCFAVTTKWNQA